VVLAVHALVLARIVLARRAATHQRAADLRRFQELKEAAKQV